MTTVAVLVPKPQFVADRLRRVGYCWVTKVKVNCRCEGLSAWVNGKKETSADSVGKLRRGKGWPAHRRQDAWRENRFGGCEYACRNWWTVQGSGWKGSGNTVVEGQLGEPPWQNRNSEYQALLPIREHLNECTKRR